MSSRLQAALALMVAFTLMSGAQAQPMSREQAEAAGAKPLTAAETKELIQESEASFQLVNGSRWRLEHKADGRIYARRPTTAHNSASGTWSIRDDGAYCATVSWRPQDTVNWCRVMYRLEDRHYGFDPAAPASTVFGSFQFKPKG